jgi:hypothetical protein
MNYMYPSIILSYLLFLMFLGGGVYFLVKSAKDGYWGDHSEDAKYKMLEDDDNQEVKHAR